MANAYHSTGVSDVKRTYAVEAGGAATESMGGVAVIVLAILALVGVLPRVLTPIAGMVFGAAFVIEGAAIASRFSAIMYQIAEDGSDQVEMGGGVTVELAAGVSAVVLGLLALLGVVPTILLPSLVIVGGAGLLLSAGAVHQLNDLRATMIGGAPALQRIARASVSSAAAAQVLAGLAGVALGILALTGVGDPQVLTVVGLLVLGASITLSGTALSGKLLRLFRRT
jgi:hypothetical protein